MTHEIREKWMGWKFFCLSSILNFATIGLLLWFFNEVNEKDKLFREYSSGAETCVNGILQSEILNYHFAKKHQQNPDQCTECAAIITLVVEDIKDFYRNNN